MTELVSQGVLNKCNSIEDLLNLLTNNGEEIHSDIGNKGQDYSNFISRLDFFKRRIAIELPEFSLEEVLKFYIYYYKFTETIFNIHRHHRFMAAIEFELKKKQDEQ